jgi:hypothetical protein
MSAKFFQYIVIILSISVVSFSCVEDAAYENPFDPRSGSSVKGGLINGVISKYYDLEIPLDSVQLILDPSGYYFQTGPDGRFEFKNIPPGDYSLYCFREGYAADSIDFTLVNNEIQHDFRLNAIPEITGFGISTHHVSRWWPVEDRYYIDLNVIVRDKDGANDIDSVWMTIDEYDFTLTLKKGDKSGEYGIIILDYQLPVTPIHLIQEKRIRTFCSDLFGNISPAKNLFITRIIDVVPEITYPANQTVIESFPILFQWQPEFLNYPVNFKLEIYQVNFGLYTKIFEVNNLDHRVFEYNFDDSLEAGDYFWLIYIVDSSGNTSSSKEGTFRVE